MKNHDLFESVESTLDLPIYTEGLQPSRCKEIMPEMIRCDHSARNMKKTVTVVVRNIFLCFHVLGIVMPIEGLKPPTKKTWAGNFPPFQVLHGSVRHHQVLPAWLLGSVKGPGVVEKLVSILISLCFYGHYEQHFIRGATL